MGTQSNVFLSFKRGGHCSSLLDKQRSPVPFLSKETTWDTEIQRLPVFSVEQKAYQLSVDCGNVYSSGG